MKMSDHVETDIGEFPKEWEVKKLEEIAKIESGKREKGGGKETGEVISLGGEHISPDGKIILNSPKYISKKFYDSLKSGKVKEKDIILVKDGATTGKAAFLEKLPAKEVAVNEHLFIIRSKTSNIDQKFLYYIIISNIFQNQIKSSFHGIIGGITKSEIEEVYIPIPPLEEQKKIVELLQKATDIYYTLKDYIIQIRNSTETITKVIRKELLTRGIGHSDYVETDIGEFPKDWEVRRLNEIAELQRGLSYSGSEKSKDEIPDGYLFLTLNSVKEGGGLKEDGWTWIKSDRLKERHFVREGDILIANTEQSKDGSLIGSSAIVNFPEWYKKDKAVFSMDLSKLLLRISNMDVNFLFYYLSFVQPLARKYHTGTNVWHLNLDSWAKDLLVPIPPVEEQKKIVELLQKVDELIIRFNDFLQNLEDEANTLYKSILRLALTGKLTEDWRRQIILLISVVIPYLVYQASKIKGRPVYMTELMKYLFLLQKEYNINLAYNFEPYKYGPFTPQLYKDLEELKDRIEVKEVKDNVDKSLITSKELPQVNQDIANAVNDLINRFGNKDLKELLSYVYKKYPEYTIKSELNLDEF